MAAGSDVAPSGDNAVARNRRADEPTQRDVALSDRGLLAAGRAAAASGDVGAARALLTAAAGSLDSAVAAEAAAALSAVEAQAASSHARRPRKR